ncbi:Uu.00g009790.m01.CDS01 [Anthostomella pinea]|uniref:Uu.00g009790.m01.CDS01 n=1 Tax=Anthostomella pinea TaxID=933095 RepID=A0AAI8YQ12_9PEZI|nr:Uu.00g009790.m01.CDS01 [Anthostomella pinea]
MTAPVFASKKHGLVAVLVLALIWSGFFLFRKTTLLQEPLNSLSSSISSSLPPAFKPSSSSNPSPRPLILYAYKESENARANLEFFLHQGLHAAADFIFILNGETDAAALIPTEQHANIRVVQRANTCFDLGAFGEVLREGDLWRQYSRFITLNASIRGPFLPTWSDQCWSDAYLDRITERVKLVGMTVNCWPRPHLQSMIWTTDAVGMAILLDPPANASEPDMWGGADDTVAFGGCYAEFQRAIHAEIGATPAIRGMGYEVSAMMAAFQGEEYIDECAEHPHDVLYDGRYFGTNIHPYETIFIKANRNIDPAALELLTGVHKRPKYEGRSWDLCK